MLFIIDKNVFINFGYLRSIIYDLRDTYAELLWLDAEATKTLKKLIKKGFKSLNTQEKNFIKHLSKLIDVDIEKNKIEPYYVYLQNKPIKISFSWIEITSRCNLQCKHCYADSKKIGKDLDIKSFKHILNELSKTRIRNIQLTGGEPYMNPLLNNFIKIAIEKGFKLEIFSNLTLINDKDIEFLKKYKNSVSIACSILGNEKNMDKITGIKGSYKKFMSVLHKIKKNHIPFRICTVLTKYNYDFKYTELSDNIRKTHLRLTGRADLNLINKEILLKKLITKETFRKKIKSFYIRERFYKHNCFGYKIYISVDMNIYPCVMERRIVYGNLSKETLAKILEKNKEYLFLTKDRINTCKDCEFKYACFDCRPDSLDKDFFEKPWYCTYNPYKGSFLDKEEFINKILNRKI